MSGVTFSPAARDDLQQIFDYIRQRNPTAALTFLDRIEEKCQKLADSPDMGFPRDELSPGLRCWPVGNYVLFYRTATNGIDVIRLLHGARDAGSLF